MTTGPNGLFSTFSALVTLPRLLMFWSNCWLRRRPDTFFLDEVAIAKQQREQKEARGTTRGGRTRGGEKARERGSSADTAGDQWRWRRVAVWWREVWGMVWCDDAVLCLLHSARVAVTFHAQLRWIHSGLCSLSLSVTSPRCAAFNT